MGHSLRIRKWFKKAEGKESYPADEDPGVLSVITIFNYYKKFGYNTQIMGASFRNIDEVLELAGSSFLIITPKLLEELTESGGAVPKNSALIKQLKKTL